MGYEEWVAKLDADGLSALWTAMAAMVDDVHAPMDCLSEAEWAAAERLMVASDKAINGGTR